MEQQLLDLAARLGILTSFSDAGKDRRNYEIDENVVKFFAWQLGCHTCTTSEMDAEIAKTDLKRWQQTLDNIYVVDENHIQFDAVLPADATDFKLLIDNAETAFEIYADCQTQKIGKAEYKKFNLVPKSKFAVGYHNLELIFGGQKYQSVLAVAPQKCYEIAELKQRKLWGFALQLYSLKSAHNWGVGDFSDLCDFIKICAEVGADIVGLNPLNVLFHDNPEEASPYFSASRLFLNPIYIDVEAVEGFVPEDVADLTDKIAALRHAENIEYGKIYRLKIEVLQKIYDRLKNTPQMREWLEKYSAAKGRELDNLALFETLNEQENQNGVDYWRLWDKNLQNPNSLAVKKYFEEHIDRINFFKFLQFEAELQLSNAAKLCQKAGLKVGLYRDLAVGVGHNSAEVWSNQDLFFQKAGIGAPPDAFFPSGQKWGLAAFNPQKLKSAAYAPLINILRANMQYAGALRMDHVMSLARLYIVPDEKKTGTYIQYNLSDMLGILSIESQLNKCAVVGESIGNVPEGFIEAIKAKNVASLSVLWAERWAAGWGDFKYPHEYPQDAFVSVSTHDMPPLKCWWFGYDLATSRKVGIIKTNEELQKLYKARENDRAMLLKVLDSNNVWPQDNLRQGDCIFGEGYPNGLDEAVHKLMARSASKVFLAQLENMLQVEQMQNLPGTDRNKHPNWRRKMPVAVEDLLHNEMFARNLKAIKEER